MRLRRAGLGLLAVGVCLAACSFRTQPASFSGEPAGRLRLTTELALGQTLVADEGGLTAIEIYLEPAGAAAGSLILSLRASPDATADIAAASLPLASVAAPGYYRFDFEPQADSPRRDYYALLMVDGPGAVGVGTHPGEAYADGALYANGRPMDAQVAFRLTYDAGGAAWSIAGDVLRWTWWLALAAVLLVVPGWALLAWLWPASGGFSWGERLGLAVAFGSSLYPLLFLWTNVAGLNLGPLYAWLAIALGAVGLALLARSAAFRRRPNWARVAWLAWRHSGQAGPDAAFVCVMVVVAFTRWWPARLLDWPLWGDSLQHTMIVQLLLDHGGLFENWAPYADLQSFTYHFGFHAVVAGFHWISGLPAPQATLWMGQILNVAAVLALYPLGVRMGGQRWGGVVAVLVAGLLSPHPAYYINWGRYTQLAGQVLLPAALYLTWALVENKYNNRGLLAAAALVVGALALTHYRVLLMYALFVPALLVVEWRSARRLAGSLLIIGAAAALMALPWLVRTLGGPMMAFTGALLSTPANRVSAALSESAGLPHPRMYPPLFWLAAAVGTAAGWLLRRRATWLGLVWLAILVPGGDPAVIGLPGTGLVTGFAVMLAVYIGGAMLAAAGAAWLALPQASSWRPVWGLALVAVMLWGGAQRMRAVDVGLGRAPSRADARAAAWINANLPAEAVLLTRTVFGFSNTVAVGADAGWWLPLLAGRAVTTPPINYALERGGRPDYRAWVVALPRSIEQYGFDDPQVRSLLDERSVTHVYIGPLTDPAGDEYLREFQGEALAASPHFRPVYHEDRVWVFERIR